MNQILIEPENDPAKKRREYLWATTKGYATAMTGYTAAVCFGLLALGLGTTLLLLIASGFAVLLSGNPYGTANWLLGSSVLCGIALSGTGWFTYTCFKAADSVPAVPFVPPVAEQIAALPAEEVLLRGSDSPIALPGELVRAAQAAATASRDELLCVEAGAVE